VSSRTRLNRLTLAAACAAIFSSANTAQAQINKANNTTNLNATGSWVGGVVPGATSIAQWNNTVTGANTANLGGNLSWQGISILNPGGTITIGNTNNATLTLGTSGINMSTSTRDLTIAAALAAGAIQNWTVNTGRTLTVSGTLTLSNRVTLDGAGTVTLSGANTGGGGVTLTSGTLNVNNATALGATAGTFIINGGTLNNTTGNAIALTNDNAQTWAGDFVFTGTQGLDLGTGAVTLTASPTVTVNGNTLIVGGAIGGAGFALTKAGAGTLALAGANTYDGGTTVSAGALTFLNTAAKSETGTHAFGAGTTLGLGVSGASAFTAGDVSNALLGLMTGNLGGITITPTTNIGIDTTNGDFVYSSVVPSTITNKLVKLGTNTLTLSGANTFTSPISVVNGSISVSSINSVNGGTPLLASSSLGAPTTIADGTIALGSTTTTGGLIYTGTGETTDRVINLAGTSGGGRIEQAGTGNLNFSSPVTFTGAGAKRLTLAGSTMGTGEMSASIAGGFAGSATPLTIAKEGTGTWTLASTGNTATTLVMSGGILNTGTNGLTLSNVGAATIQATADSTINGKIILAGVGPANNGADVGATVAGVTLTINAVIEGGPTNNIDFWNQVTGTTILNGANTWSGQTRIAGQIVQVSSLNSVVGGTASSSLGAPSDATTGRIGLSGGATLRYAGTGETTDRVINLDGGNGSNGIIEQAGTGLLKFTSDFTATGTGASKSLILQGSTAGTGEIGGAIVNNSGANLTNLIKNGTGLWSLTGASTYTGTTTINDGTLALAGASGSTVSPTFTVNAGSTLLIDNRDTANNGDRLADAAVINMAGSTLDFSNNGGAANYSETAGTLNIAAGLNTVNTDQAAVGQTSALTFASLTRSASSTVDFTGTGLGVDTRNQVLITGQAPGNLPLWATYNSTDLAAYDATNGIVPAIYTDIAARTDVVPNGAGLSVRINSAGTPGNVTLAAPATTINALVQNTTTASIVDLAGGSIATTGIRINAGMQALTIGATQAMAP